MTSTQMVYVGGSFGSEARFGKNWCKNTIDSKAGYTNVGFRLVRTIMPIQQLMEKVNDS